MSEQYGRTDMYACGCTVTPDGFLAVPCGRHEEPELPEDLSGPEPWAKEDARNAWQHEEG